LPGPRIEIGELESPRLTRTDANAGHETDEGLIRHPPRRQTV
jgi:hypothetical protein